MPVILNPPLLLPEHKRQDGCPPHGPLLLHLFHRGLKSNQRQSHFCRRERQETEMEEEVGGGRGRGRGVGGAKEKDERHTKR